MMFKKILLMVILTMAVVGCTAEDRALWKESELLKEVENVIEMRMITFIAKTSTEI